jgi:hypothetical protein
MRQEKQTPTGTPRAKTKEQKTKNSTRTSQNRSRACDAAPARKRIPRPPAYPRISSYADSLLNRKSAGASQPAPAPEDPRARPVPRSWLTTLQVSLRSGYSVRHIQSLCDNGFFREGEDWKQRPPRPGISRRGRIFINPDALKKLDWSVVG